VLFVNHYTGIPMTEHHPVQEECGYPELFFEGEGGVGLPAQSLKKKPYIRPKYDTLYIFQA